MKTWTESSITRKVVSTPLPRALSANRMASSNVLDTLQAMLEAPPSASTLALLAQPPTVGAQMLSSDGTV